MMELRAIKLFNPKSQQNQARVRRTCTAIKLNIQGKNLIMKNRLMNI